ncbi:MAG: hypothetical protein CO150_08615 [Nitrospirae bacterium CG_4_9_14_3_um_filter_53_35]|nr:MAG: hypothetical protein AUK29_02700 [Nitrospirae bacterium CG2_30_53_67]PIS38234.1 MAG: hypothetical protein COT35_01730 [Nitrospirae bacterium CG08_land_8_20_14_0_20_52_24]PIV84256.1 MAG: hypothetical protein COW52_07670 [Nitrospirae bacterium CG17_big_fil_post_rev_8_21_14_2_50_50_9]PIW84893.1 MAG: hypothetical protein COZ95_07355 [Nitrospirae bacterium CG_4_8_14_3_um_filter_50_41]PIX86185.1 MAG: hypothetical protein COZ32_04625 [Nitrospirae bacterium CG_4_10_14_3_um_filter_53_41]PJA7308
MFKIAVPSNDGERISGHLIGSLIFLIYEIRNGRIHARSKRTQIHGIMAAVEDCKTVIVKDCPEPISELLSVKGIKTIREDRDDAERAVLGLLNGGRTSRSLNLNQVEGRSWFEHAEQVTTLQSAAGLGSE